jgi:hypothetical protein
LRPAFASFFALLDDEQKARLAVSFAPNAEASSDSKPDRRVAPVAGGPGNLIDAEPGPACRQWVGALRTWPVRQIESAIPLTDEQHAALYDVTAAIYRAAAAVASTCPAETWFTPVGRINAVEKQLDALRQGIDSIEPLLAGLENLLDDEQKVRLQSVVSVKPSSVQADVVANLNASKRRQ